ncbi:hypothetical protein AYX15_05422 [Cryptococcus neoformans]|nr:hypothetical protein AYX15_05422 [Cryptococcus neoformans var. grubii]OXG22309.1 hypothetical protein C367_04121 [Cryptococcus neoformans var. grubii Ze90-1]
MPGLLLPRRFHESPIHLRLTVHEYAERETSEIVEDHSVYVLRGVGRPHKGLDADLLAEPIEIFESTIKDIHQEKEQKMLPWQAWMGSNYAWTLCYLLLSWGLVTGASGLLGTRRRCLVLASTRQISYGDSPAII